MDLRSCESSMSLSDFDDVDELAGTNVMNAPTHVNKSTIRVSL